MARERYSALTCAKHTLYHHLTKQFSRFNPRRIETQKFRPLKACLSLPSVVIHSSTSGYTPAIFLAPPGSNCFDCANFMSEGAIQGHTCADMNLIDALHLQKHTGIASCGQVLAPS